MSEHDDDQVDDGAECRRCGKGREWHRVSEKNPNGASTFPGSFCKGFVEPQAQE